MTDEQILKKAMEKAVENGWKKEYPWIQELNLETDKWSPWVITHVIFSHSFAKAFYPKGWTCYKDGQWQDCEESEGLMSRTPFVYPKYIYHLMESVQEEQPLKYIERFL